MKSLLATIGLALACAAAQGAEPVPVIDQPGLTLADDTPAATDISAVTTAPAVPEPGTLPMLAVGVALVALRLSRKSRNDIFK